ncbi:MAG TPA: TIM barrel protein [Bryobacteraceae bacterium]|jgi:sugar phosphate isomerase/epimerase
MAIPIGATSYVFRYLLSDTANAPSLTELVRLAHEAGLDRLQICENARPLETGRSAWTELQRRACDLGLEIDLGCMTLDPAVLYEYLDRTEAIGGSDLRLVLESEAGIPLSADRIRFFLDLVLPELQQRGIRLAIENHFAIPSRTLAEAAASYPTETVGFCLDVANSLRNFEAWERVFDLLGDRAFCYHLKDYRISGSNVGFSVDGAPFGEGHIDASAILRRIFARTPQPRIYLENWTPATGDPPTDIATDAQWLARSIANLRSMV